MVPFQRMQGVLAFCLGAFLCLFVSSKAAAQYTYIVPVSGAAVGFQSQYSTKITALNPNATAATLRYEAFYSQADEACIVPPPVVIPPQSVVGLGQSCYFLHALLLTSDQPLRVMADVYSLHQ